ncbi:MAG: M56 family metallopeptidase [Thermonemataceae bacterium]|nr:M56 family metallopeptidase [Thermonemataceae bacterium]
MSNYGQIADSWYLTTACWLITYTLHSVLFFVFISLLLVFKYFKKHHFKDYALKTALFGGIITTFWQNLSGLSFFQTTILASSSVNQGKYISKNFLEKSPVTQEFNSIDWVLFVAVMSWILIATMLIIRFLVLRWSFFQKLRRANVLIDTRANQMLDNLCTQASVKIRIKLLQSEYVESPIAFGRTICLPCKATHILDEAALESMLAHELAHIIRYDDYWLQIYGWMESIFFFHSLNHILRRKLQANTEILCDAWAVKITGNQKALAQCLLEVASWLKKPTSYKLVSGMAVRKTALNQRITHLLNGENKPNKLDYQLIFIFILGCLLSMLSLFSPSLQVGYQRIASRDAEVNDVKLERFKGDNNVESEEENSLPASKTQNFESESQMMKKENSIPPKEKPLSKDLVKISPKEEEKTTDAKIEFNSLKTKSLTKSDVVKPTELQLNTQKLLQTKNRPTAIDKKTMVKSQKKQKNEKEP